MNYGDLIISSIKLFWDNKKLWILGFLPAIGSTIYQAVQPLFMEGRMQASLERSLRMMEAGGEITRSLSDYNIGSSLLTMGSGLLVSLISIIFMPALILGIVKSINGEEFTIGGVLSESKRFIGKFLALFLIIMVLGIIAGVLPFFILIPGAMFLQGFMLCLMCIFVPVVLIGSFFIGNTIMLTYPALVVDELDPMDGLKHAWNIVIRNKMNLFLLGLILVIPAYIAAMLAYAPVFIQNMGMQAELMEMIRAGRTDFTSTGVGFGFIFFGIPWMVFFGTIVSTYAQILWVKVYEALNQSEPQEEAIEALPDPS